jgi:hypothetical protein
LFLSQAHHFLVFTEIGLRIQAIAKFGDAKPSRSGRRRLWADSQSATMTSVRLV